MVFIYLVTNKMKTLLQKLFIATIIGLTLVVPVVSISTPVYAGKNNNKEVNEKKKAAEEKKKAENKKEKEAEAAQKAKHKAKEQAKKTGISCSVNGDMSKYSKSNCKIEVGAGYTKCSSYSPGAKKAGCDNDCNATTSKSEMCNNASYYCGGGDDETEECNCQDTSCPVPNTGNKFITRPVTNGTKNVCGSNACKPTQVACAPSYRNTPPTCSIVPSSISMNRTDAPKTIAVMVADNDYGDTVQVKKVRVVDAQGNLKSCVNVQTLGGGSVTNLTVKTGSDNPADVTMTTNLIADARSAHGVYAALGNGTSACSGYLEIEISDVDSDGNGLDVADTTTCRANIAVINNNPVITAISVEDRDPVASLRQAGNLITGATPSSPVYIGSSWDVRRVGLCKDTVSLDNPGICNTSNFVATKSRKNPFLLSMTVSDTDGIKDIKNLGFWLQRADAATWANVYPLTGASGRQSIQAQIGTSQDNEIDGKNYFTENACIGPNCTTDFTQTSSLLGLTLINLKGTKVQNNGAISSSSQRRSWYANWLVKGWPDCYGTVPGCTSANVPIGSTATTNDLTDFSNYDWMQSADTSHMMCLSSNQNTNSVIPVAAICPSTCAACVALTSLTKLEDGNSARASFMVTMNDRYVVGGSGAGMAEGRYELFVGAEDKVAGYVNGSYIYRAVANSSGRIPFVFDAQPPTVVLNLTNPTNTTYMRAEGTLTDVGAGASGIAGTSMRYMIKETYANPEDITGVLSFLDKNADGTDGTWDGKNDFNTTSTSGAQSFGFNGHGLVGGEGIAAGMCTFDKAGNMCCAKTINAEITSSCANYGTQGLYGYGTPWLQTSLGSVYSNTSASGTAFSMTVPETSIAQSALLTGAHAVQSGSAVSNLVISGGDSIGIIGGRKFGNDFYPLGFSSDSGKGNYRTTDVSAFNISSIGGSDRDQWYPTLFALANKYCEVSGACLTNSAAISDVSTTEKKQKVIVIKNAQTVSENLSCNGANLIFITNNAIVTITGQVTKTSQSSGCLFVVDKGAKLIVQDTATGKVTGTPSIDKFEAAVVVSKGGTFQSKGVQTLKKIVFDRLEWQGFLFDDSGSSPLMTRRLLTEDNKKYPAEWIIYDANILDIFRPMLGFERTVDVVCGTSSHILCRGK
jgi:hypothetical protein